MPGSDPSALADPLRLAELDALELIDSPRDESFDRLTRLAACALRAPITLVTLVDDRRQWFKSSVGLGEPWATRRETPLTHSFCQHVVTSGAPLVVHDAREHATLRDNRAIAEMGVVAYLGVPLRMASGAIVGSFAAAAPEPRAWTEADVATLRDFAALAIAEAASRAERRRLAENEARFRTLATAAPLGVYVADAAGGLTYCNPRILEIVGRPEPELLGDGWTRTLHPDDRAEVLARWESAVRAARDFEAEYRIARPDGTRRWVHEVARPVRDEQGAMTGAVGTLEDITARRELEEQLRQSQKLEAVGRLAGGIAHDFNNLLTAILSSAELGGEMLRDGSDGAALRTELGHDLREIVHAAKRAARLTSQLLAFARRQPMRPEVLDLSEVVRDAERLLRRVIGEHIAVRLRLAHGPMLVRADRTGLEQVLLNLAVNARDAMPQGGTLEIETIDECVPPGDWVCLVVRDTGTGMDDATRVRAFEPFFTTKPVGEGTGLGLSTVYGIVEQSGGDIAVQSAPGEGTTFVVRLPRAADAADAGPERLATPVPASRSRGTVLLVEDEAPLRDVVRRVLERAGWRVVPAADGQEALDWLALHAAPVDLVLTDVVMPGIGGVELARRLGRQRPELRVLFMSGYAPEAAHGGDPLPDDAPLLEKPFTPTALVRFLEENGA